MRVYDFAIYIDARVYLFPRVSSSKAGLFLIKTAIISWIVEET